MASVKLYGGLVQVAGGEKTTEVYSITVSSILDELISKYGDGFKNRILDSNGNPASFVRIFVNNKDIRFLKNLDTTVAEKDTIILMPAIGGG